jgi:hypothetical protein
MKLINNMTERIPDMNTYRINAIIAGTLFLVCSAATILSFPFTGPILEGKDYLSKLFASERMVITGALIEFIQAAAAVGIAIALYPILKKYNGALALGAVGFRIIECVFVLFGTLSLLSLLSLSQEFIAAGASAASSFQSSGMLLQAVKYWSINTISALAFCLGALMYYVILYQSKLIPRWLSGWGILGTVLGLAATVQGALTHDFGLESVNTFLNIPIGLQEMVFAIWLIVKGFRSSALASLNGIIEEVPPSMKKGLLQTWIRNPAMKTQH